MKQRSMPIGLTNTRSEPHRQSLGINREARHCTSTAGQWKAIRDAATPLSQLHQVVSRNTHYRLILRR